MKVAIYAFNTGIQRGHAVLITMYCQNMQERPLRPLSNYQKMHLSFVEHPLSIFLFSSVDISLFFYLKSYRTTKDLFWGGSRVERSFRQNLKDIIGIHHHAAYFRTTEVRHKKSFPPNLFCWSTSERHSIIFAQIKCMDREHYFFSSLLKSWELSWHQHFWA